MKYLNNKIQILIYVLTFIAAAVITYIVNIGGASYKETVITTMGDARLPYVYMTTEEGFSYNYLHGYTCDMNLVTMHEPITPISSDRVFSFNIKKFGCPVSEVSYELRSTDGDKLIERNAVEDANSSEDVITSTVRFRNLLEKNKEYMLRLIVDTGAYGAASYYTRIVIMDDAYLDKKLSYISNFSANTLNKSNLSQITSQLETDSTGDNTNLGRVNIHSKLSQVGYGEMEPSLISDKYITINEINGDVASVSLNYKIASDDINGKFSYNVKEYIRIYQPDDTVTYVHSYDRWVDQIFEPEKAVSSLGDLYLGICSDDKMEKKSNANGKYTAFVRNHELWEFSTSKNEFTSIFSFNSADGNDIRENYNQHDIKILNVEDNGNIKFIVYGYMNRGEHEGKAGISVFEYNNEEKKTNEIVFVPRNDSYMSIARDVDILCYLNADNILYIYSGKSIYYIDCNTKESMIVASKLDKSACILSNDRRTLVYQSGEDDTKYDKITILNLVNGNKNDIKAGEENFIKALGYMNENVVYGLAEKKNTVINGDGIKEFPMYEINMMDSDLQIVKKYSMDDIYITDVEITSGKMIIERVRKNDSGELERVEDDIMLSNVSDTAKEVSLDIRITEARQKEYYLNLIAGGITGQTTLQKTKYSFTSDATVEIPFMSEGDKVYYAYAFGELAHVSDKLADAILIASEGGGVVVDYTADMIWSRYKSKEHIISIADSMVNPSSDTKVAATNLLLAYRGIKADSADFYAKGKSVMECLKENCEKVFDLTDCTVEMVQYFINMNYPIIVKTDTNRYEVIYGYDRTHIFTKDMTDGTNKEYSFAGLNEIISGYGNVMITATK